MFQMDMHEAMKTLRSRKFRARCTSREAEREAVLELVALAEQGGDGETRFFLVKWLMDMYVRHEDLPSAALAARRLNEMEIPDATAGRYAVTSILLHLGDAPLALRFIESALQLVGFDPTLPIRYGELVRLRALKLLALEGTSPHAWELERGMGDLVQLCYGGAPADAMLLEVLRMFGRSGSLTQDDAGLIKLAWGRHAAEQRFSGDDRSKDMAELEALWVQASEAAE